MPMPLDLEMLKLPPFYHEMILVEGGTFLMGGNGHRANQDETPAHRVVLDRFYVGKFPVTQALWKLVMGEMPNETFFAGDDLPMGGISWQDANLFIQKLNELTQSAHRLPTEAEWEFAARGGIHSKGCLFAGGYKIDAVAWSVTTSRDDGPQPVGGKTPNELGLHDMCGNLYEWCHDWYDEAVYAERARLGMTLNPEGPQHGNRRVLRGGSWNSPAAHCRSTFRHKWQPQIRAAGFGMRLAISVPLMGGGNTP